MAGILSRLFGRRPDGAGYRMAGPFRMLRDKILSTTPAEIGVTRESAPGGVWAVLAEIGFPEAVATLLAIADGTVSMYYSNGGGMIGLGEHDGPRQAGRELLEFAPSFRSLMQSDGQHPLPAMGNVRFTLLTFDGAFAAEAAEADLKAGGHPLSSLFLKMHELITECRLASEAQGQG